MDEKIQRNQFFANTEKRIVGARGLLGLLCAYTNIKDRPINSKKLLKILEADGWELVRVKGSHHHLQHKTKLGTITVPHPKKDLPPGTVHQILKTAGLK